MLLSSRKVSLTRSHSMCSVRSLLFLLALKRRASGRVFVARTREATRVLVLLWRLGVEKTPRSKMRFLATLRLNRTFHVRQQQVLHQAKPEENMHNLHKALWQANRRGTLLPNAQGLVPKPMRRSVVVKNNVRAAASSAYCWWFSSCSACDVRWDVALSGIRKEPHESRTYEQACDYIEEMRSNARCYRRILCAAICG